MKKEEIYITAEGLEELKAEHNDLVTNKRKDVAKALKEAKEFGDLSENTDWDDAKARQQFIEGRISEIENIIKHARVIAKASSSEVGVGSTVVVSLDDGEQTFKIVGSTEANPEQGKISDASPIGKALIGRKVGEAVDVEIPAGTISYTIKKVQ